MHAVSRLPAIALALALVAVATMWLHPARAEETRTSPRFEPARCWFDMTETPNARCGRLYVPENRRVAESRVIGLAVVVLPPDSAAPGEEPNPVVYLTGGPGYGSGIEAEGIAGWISWRKDVAWLLGRTLVLVDPRGTGLSEPLMACPEITEAYFAYYGSRPSSGDAGADEAKETAPWRDAGTACRDRLVAAGIDLAAYDSAATAADVADLRVALGYATWDVWGVSYGTRVALALMRDRPEGIRTAILDSLYPPEAMGYAELAAGTEGAFHQLFTDCAADAACDAAYPELEDKLSRALAWLDERPITFPVVRPDTGAKVRVILNGERFLDLLFTDFYDWERITYLPDIIDSAARRDIPFLRSYVEWLAENLPEPEFSDGLQLSMECREEFPFNPEDGMRAGRAAPPFSGYGRPRLELAVCPLWGAGAADAIENRPVTSAIPTLVLAGLYDPITPPAWARAAMAGLPNGFLVEFAGIGHGVIDNESCADDVVGDFLDHPDERPTPSCLLDVGPPAFDTGQPASEDAYWERRT
jgi:pimeloyl-ACP methyl ester carboxylesterase